MDDIEQLATAAFMDQAYNLILVGGTGLGKMHLAKALGIDWTLITAFSSLALTIGLL